MSRLPSVTPKEVMNVLLKAGFEKGNQTGSHLRLIHRVTGRKTTIPVHARDLKRGTLKAILKQTGISEEEFLTLL